MNERIMFLSVLLILIFSINVIADGWVAPDDPTAVDWSTYPVQGMSGDYLNNNPDVANLIPESRINEFSPEARNAYVQAKFPGVTANLGTGDVQLNGNTLTVAGTTVDLSKMSGKTVSVSGNDVMVDGQKFTNAENVGSENGKITADKAQYFESGTTTFINAEGVKFSPNAFYVAKADSISYAGTTSTKIIDFTGESGTFSVKSADRVIVETMTFDKIVNSVFKVSNGNLLSASVECDKNNSKTTFPNLIAGTSSTITTNCDDEEKYFVSYRENPNEIVFNATENITLFLHGTYANITFNASENASLIIKPNGVFAVMNGILSYIAPTFTEQLEGNCLDYSIAEIDFANGFIKTTLLPFKDYKTGVFICPGARYNRIYENKENSFSIYNIGKAPYYLIFNKNIKLFNDLISLYNNNDDYGFIAENITLNGNIEYDRIPEKDLFPAISEEEYNKLPIEWKKVYASYDTKTRTEIEGENKISIKTKNNNGTSDTIIELNSGYFNIKEIGSSRFASFNKNIIYPDYIKEYSYNSEPLIKIENKKLIEEGNKRATVMFTPNTRESTNFLDWLKNRLAIKDLYEWLSRVNVDVEAS